MRDLMRAIVTGGAGFIGSHIVRQLISDGNEVIVIDDLSTGSLARLSGLEGVKFIKGRSSLIKNMPAADVVFHEGAPSSTPLYRNDRTNVARVVEDFINVAEYCVKNNAKLVFASSSSIYNGHPPKHREDMLPKVTDFYTEVKYLMERLADLYSQMHGLEYVALRYFSVYGDGEEAKKHFANMVSQAIWKIVLDKEIVIYGDGSQRRDFTYVDDIVSANMLAYEKDVSGVFNVGTGISYSFNEMLGVLKEVTGREAKVRYVPNPLKNYVNVVEADTKKSESVLGFVPKVKFEEGVGKTFEYYSKLGFVPDLP